MVGAAGSGGWREQMEANVVGAAGRGGKSNAAELTAAV